MEEDIKANRKDEILRQYEMLKSTGVDEGKIQVVNIDAIRYNYILKSKVKGKIERFRRVISDSNDGDLIHDLIQRIKILEELLGEE